MDNTKRFSNRVENYVRYRPHYPPEIIPFLESSIGLSSHSTIADIGSGTGISSEIFLQNGNRVYAIEPNNEMRQAAEKAFTRNKNFISVNATAEATTLPANCINLITAGQAFHWFDKAKCKKEFQRIAAPGAHLCLMWNEWKLDSDFLKAYENLVMEFGIDYKKLRYSEVDEDLIKEFFTPFTFTRHSFPNSQTLDYEGLKGRLLSSSYAPLEGAPNYAPMLAELRRIFDKFSHNAQVEFVYNCNLYYGKLN